MKNMIATAAKSSKVQTQERIDYIIELLSNKYKRSQIIENIAMNKGAWNIKTQTIDRYIRMARAQMMETVMQTHSVLKGEAANDLRYLYKKALEADDYTLALRVRQELSRLYHLHGAAPGLTEPEEKDITPKEVGSELSRIFQQATEPVEVVNPIAETDSEEERKGKRPGRRVVQPKDAEPERGSSFAKLGL